MQAILVVVVMQEKTPKMAKTIFVQFRQYLPHKNTSLKIGYPSGGAFLLTICIDKRRSSPNKMNTSKWHDFGVFRAF